MNLRIKIAIGCVGSFIGGTIIGSLCGYFFSKNKFIEENREEIAALTHHYEQMYGRNQAVPKKTDEKAPDENTPNNTVDTHAVNYTSFYSAKAVPVSDILARQHPEDEDESYYNPDSYGDDSVVEISEGYYNLGKHPFKELAFLPSDGTIMIVDWGDNEPLVEEGRDDLLQMEEDEIVSRITPVIKQSEFERRYDVIYILDKDRNEQYKVSKRYGENLENV